MKILSKVIDIQSWRKRIKPRTTIGFVPTMGALHKAHGALIERSQKENDITVVSIFVNPLQFGKNEDFGQYPRPKSKDRAFLRHRKVQILFAPTSNSMYPSKQEAIIKVPSLTKNLCASPKSRGPDHFDGVATVVAKLFSMVRPQRAYFGLKDFQQVRVIEEMNKSLNLAVKIIRCQTIREADGLAVSSRNAYLNPQDRAQATKLYESLQYGRKLLRSYPRLSLKTVRQRVYSHLKTIPQSRIDYVDLVDPVNLQKLKKRKGPALLAAAVWIKKTRLIDNVLVN